MGFIPGPKSPSQHAATPTMKFQPARTAMVAPRYAEKLNMGPGMAWMIARPALNCCWVTQVSGSSLHTYTTAKFDETIHLLGILKS